MPQKSSKRPVLSLVRTSPENVIQDYYQLMHLVNYTKHLHPHQDLLLKLNLSWSLYYPACSTQPWQLHGILETLQKDHFPPHRLFPLENKTVVTNPQKGAKLNKWLPLLDQYHLSFTNLSKVKWVPYHPKHQLLALPEVFPEIHQIPEIFLNKNILHLPTLKTHGHTTITGSIKNAFGGLINEKRHHCHKKIHQVLVDLLALQQEIHPNIFAVIDGTVAGSGAGPRTMIPRQTNLLLAGSDQVALDALAAKLMGFDPMKIPFLKMAHDQGLGLADLDQVEIRGENYKQINLNFQTRKSPVIFWDQVFRKGPLKFVEPFLFHSGLFKLCVFGSAFYHDYLWYPTIGQSRIRKFKKTEWGRLWQKY